MSQNSSPAPRRWEGHDLVVIPVEILSATDAEGKPLSGTAVRLWIALATFANAKNVCWPSNRTLLALLPPGISRRTIQRAKSELAGSDLLRITHRLTEAGRQTSDLYELRIPEGDNTDGEGAILTAPVGANGTAPEGGENGAPLNLEVEPHQKEVGEVEQVFGAWVRSTGKDPDRTRLDGKRRRLITTALQAYPVDDLVVAVQGWEKSAFHRGENERGKVYNDLGLILRDAQHIEEFRDLFHSPAAAERAASWGNLAEVLSEE